MTKLTSDTALRLMLQKYMSPNRSVTISATVNVTISAMPTLKPRRKNVTTKMAAEIKNTRWKRKQEHHQVLYFAIQKNKMLVQSTPSNGHLVKADTSLKRTHGVGPCRTSVIYFIPSKADTSPRWTVRAGPECVCLRGSRLYTSMWLSSFSWLEIVNIFWQRLLQEN